MGNRFAVILAAGQGTRMKSELYKVLHPVVGRPMVQHVIDQLNLISLNDLVTVVGYGSEKVIKEIGDKSNFVIQDEQLGTGHAVQQAADFLKDKEGTTIVVCGDTPLITNETYQALFDHHEKEESKATILTANAINPTGYGRVIRNESNQVERIVEHKDAGEDERLVNEINTGTYCFDNKQLFMAIEQVSNDNVQGEYYLPDVIEILRNQSEKVSAFQTADFEETLGVNDRVALAQAEKVMKRRINENHMRNGVTIIDPDNTYIGLDVKLEQDVTIQPGSILTGSTTIENQALIGPNAEIHNGIVGKAAIIKNSMVKDSTVGAHANIGPYAVVRPESKIGEKANIGHFVELKKAEIGEHSKIPHLSYIGDAEIGSHVNVGCGTITVNYDGTDKHMTTIEDDAFIGCNSNLVAPVTVGKSSYVAAGSTITKNVPGESLAFGRARQTNKEGYATRFRNQPKK